MDVERRTNRSTEDSWAIFEGRELDVRRNGGGGLFLQGGSATLKAGYHVDGSIFKDNVRDGQWLVDVELGFSMLNHIMGDFRTRRPA